MPVSGQLAGRLVLLFDVDEHTGGFGGARAYFEGPGAPGRAAGVMIGYPGPDHLVTGAAACCAPSCTRAASPAIPAAAPRPRTPSPKQPRWSPHSSARSFPPAPTGASLPSRLTVTEISGGTGYSAFSDLCTVKVDVRLTPAFDATAAEAMLLSLAAQVDAAWPGTEPTRIQLTMCWPPYRLGDDSPLQTALLTAARQAPRAAAKIAGPSNIGNYLAGLGIEATAGFGVDYRACTAPTNASAPISIPPIQAAYHQACLALPASSSPADRHQQLAQATGIARPAPRNTCGDSA